MNEHNRRREERGGEKKSIGDSKYYTCREMIRENEEIKMDRKIDEER